MYEFCLILIILVIIMVIYGRGATVKTDRVLPLQYLIPLYTVVEINGEEDQLTSHQIPVHIRSPTFFIGMQTHRDYRERRTRNPLKRNFSGFPLFKPQVAKK